MDYSCAGSGSEDDVFYEEIRRQILILTADDEDEDDNFLRSHNPWSSINTAKRSLNNVGSTGGLMAGGYFSWSENGGCESVPIWLSNLWKNNGNGTGVFIPRNVKSGRRNKPRRRNNGGRYYKQVSKNNT